MNYCIDLKSDFKYYDNPLVTEVKIRYDYTHVQHILRAFDKFTQDIVLCINTIEDVSSFCELDMFSQLQNVRKRVKICIPIIFVYDVPDFIKKMDSHGFKWFFSKIFSDEKMLFETVEEFNVSEVYIGGDLGFNIMDISDELYNLNIKVRVYPTVALSDSGRIVFTDNTAFYIIPESIDAYEPYIDTIEFDTCEKKGNTLFKIYALDKHFHHDLRFLIYGLETPFPLYLVKGDTIDMFTKTRLNCGRDCVGLDCHLCDLLCRVSNHLAEHDLSIDMNFKKFDENENL